MFDILSEHFLILKRLEVKAKERTNKEAESRSFWEIFLEELNGLLQSKKNKITQLYPKLHINNVEQLSNEDITHPIKGFNTILYLIIYLYPHIIGGVRIKPNFDSRVTFTEDEYGEVTVKIQDENFPLPEVIRNIYYDKMDRFRDRTLLDEINRRDVTLPLPYSWDTFHDFPPLDEIRRLSGKYQALNHGIYVEFELMKNYSDDTYMHVPVLNIGGLLNMQEELYLFLTEVEEIRLVPNDEEISFTVLESVEEWKQSDIKDPIVNYLLFRGLETNPFGRFYGRSKLFYRFEYYHLSRFIVKKEDGNLILIEYIGDEKLLDECEYNEIKYIKLFENPKKTVSYRGIEIIQRLKNVPF